MAKGFPYSRPPCLTNGNAPLRGFPRGKCKRANYAANPAKTFIIKRGIGKAARVNKVLYCPFGLVKDGFEKRLTAIILTNTGEGGAFYAFLRAYSNDAGIEWD